MTSKRTLLIRSYRRSARDMHLMNWLRSRESGRPRKVTRIERKLRKIKLRRSRT